jgi:hypothetical protein
VLDEVEQPVVGPVDVLEDEHERAPPRDRLEEVPPGGERRPSLIGAGVLGVAEPDERLQVAFDPARLGGDRDEVAHRGVQLGRGGRRAVRLEHAGLGLDDLAERPEGHALGVGRRASETEVDEVQHLVDAAEQLEDEAALADPRLADDRHELRRATAAHAVEDAEQEGQLRAAADERLARRLTDADAPTCTRGDRLPYGDRFCLALRVDRLGQPVVDDVARRTVGRVVDEDRVGRRRGLQTRRSVEDVPPGQTAALVGLRTEGDERFAGRHADVDVQVELGMGGVELRHGIEARQGRADGSLGVVLVGAGRAEEHEDRVADELGHRSAEGLELAADARVVDPQHLVDVLGVHDLRARGEPDQVAEQRRDDLALLRDPGADGRRERCTACAAEPEPVRVLAPAAFAEHFRAISALESDVNHARALQRAFDRVPRR